MGRFPLLISKAEQGVENCTLPKISKIRLISTSLLPQLTQSDIVQVLKTQENEKRIFGYSDKLKPAIAVYRLTLINSNLNLNVSIIDLWFHRLKSKFDYQKVGLSASCDNCTSNRYHDDGKVSFSTRYQPLFFLWLLFFVFLQSRVSLM